MKFGNHTLRRADHIHEGDEVCFEFRSTGYVVESVETTAIGMIRHNHSTGSNSYWPNELLYVKDAAS